MNRNVGLVPWKYEGDGPWRETKRELPPECVVVEVQRGTTITRLVYDHGLWWLPDRSMYVYYEPEAWRPLVKKLMKRESEWTR